MNGAAPRVSVTMLQHGKAIKAAAPGSKITLEVKVRKTQPGHLHYRWTSDSPANPHRQRNAVFNPQR